MLKLAEEWRLNQPAERVWPLISDLGGLTHLHPDVREVAIDESNRSRSILLASGGYYRERVLDIDQKRRQFTVAFDGAEGLRLPYDGYRCTVRVQVEVPGKSCAILVKHEYNTADMSEDAGRSTLRAHYDPIVAAIEEGLSNQPGRLADA